MNETLPNILFFMTDQQRFDHVGWAENAKLKTPNLDRLSEGCVFTKCQSVNPICQPARTALLTGKYSHQIGTLDMSGDLDLRHPTYPQALKRAGYWTAGVGKFHYFQNWPFSAERGKGIDLTKLREAMKHLGFDHVWEVSGKQLAVKDRCDYTDYLEGIGLLEEYRDMVEARGANRKKPDQELARDGAPWPFNEEHHVDTVTGRKIREAIANRPADAPFFVFGSFCGPHKPFDPPARFYEEEADDNSDDFIPGDCPLTKENRHDLWKLRKAYRANIRQIDEEIGLILKQLEEENLLDNTVILFTSDHGELMGDHARVQKGDFWRESLEVPTAIRHPQYLNGSACHTPVELTDLTATILDIAGLNPAEALSKSFPAFHNRIPCRSLMPILREDKKRIRDYAFSESKGEWNCLVSDRFKYARRFAPEIGEKSVEYLFDMTKDPREIKNLADDPGFQHELYEHRNRLLSILETTPSAQHGWTPLMSAP